MQLVDFNTTIITNSRDGGAYLEMYGKLREQ